MVARLIPGVRANGVALTLLTPAFLAYMVPVTMSRSGHGAIKCPVFDCESDRTKGLVTAGGGFLRTCLLEKAGHCPPYVDM